MPLTYLYLKARAGIKDLTPLAECKELETLVIPDHFKAKQIEFLRKLPNLHYLGYQVESNGKPLEAEEFWKKYGGGGKK